MYTNIIIMYNRRHDINCLKCMTLLKKCMYITLVAKVYNIMSKLSSRTCAALFCSTLVLPSNGDITYAPDTTQPFSYGTTAVYSCSTGFALMGNVVRTCEGDDTLSAGVWSGRSASCIGNIVTILRNFQYSIIRIFLSSTSLSATNFSHT